MLIIYTPPEGGHHTGFPALVRDLHAISSARFHASAHLNVAAIIRSMPGLPCAQSTELKSRFHRDRPCSISGRTRPTLISGSGGEAFRGKESVSHTSRFRHRSFHNLFHTHKLTESTYILPITSLICEIHSVTYKPIYI